VKELSIKPLSHVNTLKKSSFKHKISFTLTSIQKLKVKVNRLSN